MLPALKEGSIKTRCVAKQTPIKAVTEKGLDRSVTIAGNNPLLALPLHDMNLKVNLLANECNKVATCREMVKLMITGAAFKEGSSFNSGEHLEGLMSSRILREYSDFDRYRGVSRESDVIPIRHVDNHIVSMVTYFIDTPMEDIFDDFDPVGKIYSEDFYSHMTNWNDFQRQMAFAVWARATKAIDDNAQDQCRNVMRLKKHISKSIKENGGVTVELLWYVVNVICPGYKSVRKSRALFKLMDIYNLNPIHLHTYLQTTPHPSHKEIDTTLLVVEEDNVKFVILDVDTMDGDKMEEVIEEKEELDCPEVYSDWGGNPSPIIAAETVNECESTLMEKSTSESSISESLTSESLTSESSTSENILDSNTCETPLSEVDLWSDDIPSTGSTPISAVDDSSAEYDYEPLDDMWSPTRPPLDVILASVIAEDSSDALRVEANRLLSLDTDTIIDSYNDAIRTNLLTYVPLDAGDVRQQALMLSVQSPLPSAYRTGPGFSPRYYSKEADNLFYCRKSMRLTALKGLGLFDVDLTSCHTYVLIAQWGSRLPLLSEAISNGSLWDMYKAHFASHGLPFFKKAVKPLHYASILGGGSKAFKTSVRRYNLEAELHNIKHSDDLWPVLTDDDADNYISVFKLSPVYQEIRGLLKYLSNRWHNKYIMLPTGERFAVESYSFVKGEDGKTRRVLGNFLSVYSSYLQSVEVTIMSYLIIDCHEYFTPLLWQHDGLTIKCHDDSTLDRLKASLYDACVLFMNGVQIPLSVEYLG